MTGNEYEREQHGEGLGNDLGLILNPGSQVYGMDALANCITAPPNKDIFMPLTNAQSAWLQGLHGSPSSFRAVTCLRIHPALPLNHSLCRQGRLLRGHILYEGGEDLSREEFEEGTEASFSL